MFDPGPATAALSLVKNKYTPPQAIDLPAVTMEFAPTVDDLGNHHVRTSVNYDGYAGTYDVVLRHQIDARAWQSDRFLHQESIERTIASMLETMEKSLREALYGRNSALARR